MSSTPPRTDPVHRRLVVRRAVVLRAVARHAAAYAVAGAIVGVLDASPLPDAWPTLLVGSFLGVAQRVAVGPATGPAWIAASGLAWTGGALLVATIQGGAMGATETISAGVGSWVVPLTCTIAAQMVLLGAKRAAITWMFACIVGAFALQATATGACALLCRPIASTVGPSLLPVVLTTLGFVAFGTVAGIGWTLRPAVARQAP